MMCDPVSQCGDKKISALGLVDGLFPERSVPVRPAPDLLRPCIEETLPVPLKADVILMIPLAMRDLVVSFDEIVVIDYFFQKIAHANKNASSPARRSMRTLCLLFARPDPSEGNRWDSYLFPPYRSDTPRTIVVRIAEIVVICIEIGEPAIRLIIPIGARPRANTKLFIRSPQTGCS